MTMGTELWEIPDHSQAFIIVRNVPIVKVDYACVKVSTPLSEMKYITKGEIRTKNQSSYSGVSAKVCQGT